MVSGALSKRFDDEDRRNTGMPVFFRVLCLAFTDSHCNIPFWLEREVLEYLVEGGDGF